MDIRIGFGYDTHRLDVGRKLILGGVVIPHEKGLWGHSDADVLLHAVCDALLGAACLRDIGYHFPDTDPRYKGMSSDVFVTGVMKLLREKGYEVGNIDCTIVAEAPKMNPHIPAMQEIIAGLLGVERDRVSLKATRNEGMGPIGKGEGIAVHAVALIRKN